MSRQSRNVGSIRTRGFGHEFGWADEAGPALSWNDFLRDELNLESRLAILSMTKALNVLNYAPVVERQVHKGRTEPLEKLKIRLSGALDLFCLD